MTLLFVAIWLEICVMPITDYADLKERFEKLLLFIHMTENLLQQKMLRLTGSMAVLLKDAMKPNLIQTLNIHLH